MKLIINKKTEEKLKEAALCSAMAPKELHRLTEQTKASAPLRLKPGGRTSGLGENFNKMVENRRSDGEKADQRLPGLADGN